MSAFSDNKLRMAVMMENNVGKGENAGYQHFLPFPQWFQKAAVPGLLKPEIVWFRVKMTNLEVSINCNLVSEN